jgi:hypothetical protein
MLSDSGGHRLIFWALASAIQVACGHKAGPEPVPGFEADEDGALSEFPILIPRELRPWEGPVPLAVSAGGTLTFIPAHRGDPVFASVFPNGKTRSWGREGTGPGEVSRPGYLFGDSAGIVYVDRRGRKLVRFNPSETGTDFIHISHLPDALPLGWAKGELAVLTGFGGQAPAISVMAVQPMGPDSLVPRVVIPDCSTELIKVVAEWRAFAWPPATWDGRRLYVFSPSDDSLYIFERAAEDDESHRPGAAGHPRAEIAGGCSQAWGAGSRPQRNSVDIPVQFGALGVDRWGRVWVHRRLPGRRLASTLEYYESGRRRRSRVLACQPTSPVASLAVFDEWLAIGCAPSPDEDFAWLRLFQIAPPPQIGSPGSPAPSSASLPVGGSDPGAHR